MQKCTFLCPIHTHKYALTLPSQSFIIPKPHDVGQQREVFHLLGFQRQVVFIWVGSSPWDQCHL